MILSLYSNLAPVAKDLDELPAAHELMDTLGLKDFDYIQQTPCFLLRAEEVDRTLNGLPDGHPMRKNSLTPEKDMNFSKQGK